MERFKAMLESGRRRAAVLEKVPAGRKLLAALIAGRRTGTAHVVKAGRRAYTDALFQE
jgi:hypothetical protein